MPDEPRDPELFRFRDPQQERIYRRLLQFGPGPAGFYQDACRLMVARPPLKSTTHVVAHLLREIEGALRDALESLAHWTGREAKKEKSGEERHKEKILATLKGLGIEDPAPPHRDGLPSRVTQTFTV